jgi:hypothetical protein
MSFINSLLVRLGSSRAALNKAGGILGELLFHQNRPDQCAAILAKTHLRVLAALSAILESSNIVTDRAVAEKLSRMIDAEVSRREST